MAGHDHDLQHNVKLSDPDDDSSDPAWPHHVVSGAGSQTRKNEKKNYKGKVSERDGQDQADSHTFTGVQHCMTGIPVLHFKHSGLCPSPSC